MRPVQGMIHNFGIQILYTSKSGLLLKAESGEEWQMEVRNAILQSFSRSALRRLGINEMRGSVFGKSMLRRWSLRSFCRPLARRPGEVHPRVVHTMPHRHWWEEHREAVHMLVQSVHMDSVARRTRCCTLGGIELVDCADTT